MSDGEQLLAEYAATSSELAFHEIVTRYVDLVHSTAARLVNNDIHLAQDVTQTVFADLARMAPTFSPDVMLGGWLHRHTCFVARNTMRGERRRQDRERQAVEMNSMEDHSAENLCTVAPFLDDAIDQLGSEDRKAILLRFFEQRDFHSVGAAMGSNEEAARKRVNRALEKLHGLLQRRGVSLSVAALGTILGAHAVSAAPAGMAGAITATALATAAVGTATTTSTVMTIMSIKMKTGILGAIVIAAAIPWVMENRANTKLRAENETLRQQVQSAQDLAAENARLSNIVAVATAKPSEPSADEHNREVLKLRGELGRLRTVATTPKPSVLSGITANSEMMKMIRTQNRMALQAVYKEFAKKANLTPEQSEKLADMLADNVVDSIGHITSVLSEGKSRDEINALFDDLDAVSVEKMHDLLGPEAFAQYQEYTQDLACSMTVAQFKTHLTGDKTAKEKQLLDVMREETRSALAGAGLRPDFQTVPMFNLRNIASEEEAEQNLRLLQDIYERTATRAGSFLTAAELTKFGEFRTNAMNSSRMQLTLNRQLMAPVK
jgi:RNA polymerase sigma factor (sigma-70 family)